MTRVIVILADRSRHIIEAPDDVLARGKLEFLAAQPGIDGEIPFYAPVDVRYCYRSGSDDGVPVFVER